jgi:hypothetical protein
LKTRRSFSYTITTKKFLFLTMLLLFAQCKMHYWFDLSSAYNITRLTVQVRREEKNTSARRDLWLFTTTSPWRNLSGRSSSPHWKVSMSRRTCYHINLVRSKSSQVTNHQ